MAWYQPYHRRDYYASNFCLTPLATAHGIPVEQADGGHVVSRKADAINSALASAKVYEKLDQKSVTAWLDLRNKAAHGHYDQYTADQVRLMIDGVRHFLVRVPVTLPNPRWCWQRIREAAAGGWPGRTNLAGARARGRVY